MGIVGAYVDHFGPLTRAAAYDLAEKIGRPGRKVLDLCCGQGDLTHMLVQAGAQVSGLDFSAEMIALARNTAPDAELRQGDAQALPYADGCFDAVVCNFGMMHLPEQPRALAEIQRVLVSGGDFAMATWAAPDVSPAFGTVFGALKDHADFSVSPPQPDLFAFARPESAKEMISAADLTMTAHDTIATVWELSEPEDLFEIFRTATVGARMLISSQKESVIQAIGKQIAEKVAAQFATGNGYRVPVSIAVVSAHKP